MVSSPNKNVSVLKKIYSVAKRIKGIFTRLRFETRLRARKIFQKYPLVIEDVYGIKTILYPWDIHPIDVWVNKEVCRVEFKAIEKIVKAGNIVFDIGANAGIFAVFLSRLVSGNGRVYAFEPVPQTYWRLKETIALNRCANITAVEKAILDKEGASSMNIFNDEYSVWNTFGRPVMSSPQGNITPNRVIEVSCDTIDNFCFNQNIAKINFLKVDVEGFEKHVFSGAQHFLKEHLIEYICFEISEDPLKGAGIAAPEVFSLLEGYGYLVYEFDEYRNIFCGPIHSCHKPYANYFATFMMQ